MTNIVGVIPARYASQRLPGKPLVMIDGQPMIQHVYERALLAKSIDEVCVATDDPRVQQAVEAFGGRVYLTAAECASGTDRLAELAQKHDAPYWINIQGDEPLIDPESIDQLVQLLLEDEDADMATLAVLSTNVDIAADSNVVKVVSDQQGYALYFSRASIPAWRDPSSGGSFVWHKHLGLYAYRREALLRFAAEAPTPLEALEQLEQLRALELGMRIRVGVTRHDSIGVDTPEDLARVEAICVSRHTVKR